MTLPIFYHYEDNANCTERLKETYKHCRKLNPSTDRHIWKLSDCKGTLNVYWVRKPSRYMERAIETAWNLVGELGVNVDHYWSKKSEVI